MCSQLNTKDKINVKVFYEKNKKLDKNNSNRTIFTPRLSSTILIARRRDF